MFADDGPTDRDLVHDHRPEGRGGKQSQVRVRIHPENLRHLSELLPGAYGKAISYQCAVWVRHGVALHQGMA